MRIPPLTVRCAEKQVKNGFDCRYRVYLIKSTKQKKNEKSVLKRKSDDPKEKVFCPRCGNEIIYEVNGAKPPFVSIEIEKTDLNLVGAAI